MPNGRWIGGCVIVTLLLSGQAVAGDEFVADRQRLALEPPTISTQGMGSDAFMLLQRPPSSDDGWHYRSRPAVWLAGIEGTIGRGTHLTDVDASFSDLFDDLDIGLALDLELGKGPITLLFFGMWQKFEADAETPLEFDADAEAQFAIVDLGLAYRFMEVPLGNSGMKLDLEAIAGVRWTYLSTEIEINQGPLAGVDQDREKNWFDPYLGLRGTVELNDQLSVWVMGTGGGFGVGSDCTWSATAMLEWRILQRLGLVLGYRAIGQDYDDDGFVWDVTLHGPVVGLLLEW